jgi:DNA-binding winged helix-turn-helix (wHTH) protein
MKSDAVPSLPVCSLPNDDALAPLLERLLRYARSKLRNEAMAEDAVSETLLAALEAPCDFDSPTRTSVWPELLARLKALLRRVDAIAQGMRSDHRTIESGGLLIDRLARQARLNGKVLELTPREFDLLQYFVQHPERVFSRIELLNRVWGSRHDGYEHTVNTHINRLRSKIEADPRMPSRIVTVWGAGYKFSLPAGTADAPE